MPTNSKPKKVSAVLTIAGSDSGGGAGIQADLHTFAALGMHGCSAITAITAQNTVGVNGVWPVDPDAVAAQIRAVLLDLPIKAIKIGMLFQAEIVESVVAELSKHPDLPLVVDPVLVASSGDALAEKTALISCDSFWELLRRATLVTPNLNEAAQLLDTALASNQEEMLAQGQALLDKGITAVLVKGGHLSDTNVDCLLSRENQSNSVSTQLFHGKKVTTRNTHGTGCTLSAAIAGEMAQGKDLGCAVKNAKHYLTQALVYAQQLRYGEGAGPVQHFFHLPTFNAGLNND